MNVTAAEQSNLNFLELEICTNWKDEADIVSFKLTVL
jgi:hypothetical protein